MIRVTSILLLVFISTKVSSVPQAPGPNDGGEAVGQALKGLLDENNLDESSSYRCGVFFAGDNPGDPPRFAIFVVPKRFPMNCDRDPEVIKAEAKKECFDLFSVILKKVNMESGSRQRKGFRIGDDLCKTLKDDAGMKRLPGPGHRRFPDGIAVGFYSNACTDTAWYDTELRAPDNVCCDRKSVLYDKCP